MRTYLAGAMEYAPDEGAAWRREMAGFIRKELGHTCFNPCEEQDKVLTEEEIANFSHWKANDTARFRNTARKFIDLDLKTVIDHTDYLICLWDEYVTRGGGTHGELTISYYHNIPVYMVHTMPPSEISSWIIGCTTEMFADFSQLKSFLRETYG